MAKQNNKKVWILMGMILVTALLYFWVAKSTEKRVTQPFTIEKKGAGAVADYTEATQKIHRAVDDAINVNGVAVKDRKESSKEVPRQKVEGTIRWSARQLLLSVDKDSWEQFQQKLAAAVHKEGGQILASQPDTYRGAAVTRIDVGLRDKLAGDDLTIVSDHIYMTKENGAVGQETGKSAPKPGKVRAQLAVIIDDFGYSHQPIGAFASIPQPLTFSVLPYHLYSNEAATRGVSSGHQVILHLPMEPLNAAEQSEKTTIVTSMSDTEIQETAEKALHAVPGIIGVNNHQGSRATGDKRVMRDVLRVLKNNDLFFVDSRTSAQSVAADMARTVGVPTGENQLFIDNTDNVAAISRQLRVAEEIALRHGSAIVIGHARMNTAAALQETIPELESDGIQFVFVSQLVK